MLAIIVIVALVLINSLFIYITMAIDDLWGLRVFFGLFLAGNVYFLIQYGALLWGAR